MKNSQIDYSDIEEGSPLLKLREILEEFYGDDFFLARNEDGEPFAFVAQADTDVCSTVFVEASWADGGIACSVSAVFPFALRAADADRRTRVRSFMDEANFQLRGTTVRLASNDETRPVVVMSPVSEKDVGPSVNAVMELVDIFAPCILRQMFGSEPSRPAAIEAAIQWMSCEESSLSQRAKRRSALSRGGDHGV